MKKEKVHDQTAEFEKALKRSNTETYLLRLYVTGSTEKSMRAIENVKALCEEYLKGRYTLEVVDIYQQGELAQKDNIIAAPTVIKRLPLPLRKLIGDLSSKDRILVGLDLRPKS